MFVEAKPDNIFLLDLQTVGEMPIDFKVFAFTQKSHPDQRTLPDGVLEKQKNSSSIQLNAA